MILLGLRGGGASNPLNTRVWGAHNFEVKKFSSLAHQLAAKVLAFTMSELLISLTIIGVIAAIILPNLLDTVNEKGWLTQKKVLYNRLNQAISLMPSMNGYGRYVAEVKNGDVVTTAGVDNAAEVFITKGLKPNFQMKQVCAAEYGASDTDIRKTLKQCGISEKYSTQFGDTKNFPVNYSNLTPPFNFNNNDSLKAKTNVAGFITADDCSVAILYNPQAADEYSVTDYYSYPMVTSDVLSAVFIYDLNGLSRPNKIGKDMGVFAVIFSSHPELYNVDPKLDDLQGTDSLSGARRLCAYRDKSKSFHIPTLNEMYAIVATRTLISLPSNFYTVRRSMPTQTQYLNQEGNVWSYTPLVGGGLLWCKGAATSSEFYALCNRNLFKSK